MPLRLRVAMAQINGVVGDLDGNTRKIAAAIAAAREGHADLVTFPELAITGYPPEDLLFRRSFIDGNLRALRSLALLTKNISAVIGFVDRDRKGLYNAAAFLSKGRIERVYRKMELPNYGVFDEKRYFIRGERPEIVEVKGVRVALTVCEDIWEVRNAIYVGSLAGKADLIINISASPFEAGKQKIREAIVAKLARKTRTAVVYHNLVGGQDELVFDGGSFAVGSSGALLVRAKRFHEDLRFVNFSAKTGKLKPLAGKEEEVYEALVLGTRDYIRKNGFTKALIGLSGGIDSALVSCVAADALGAENVLGVTMPSPFTSQGTLRDALLSAKNLGIRCLNIGIEPLMRDYSTALRGEFGSLPPGLAEENLQARIRGNVLMALSNKFGHIVLATGNKSEMATGYCTLYGDMCGGFAPIKDVPKTLVFALARYRNRLSSGGTVIPESVLRRPPSAELRHNQKDQDTLPPYSVLDRFLREYVERNSSIDEVVQSGVPRPVALKLAKMVRASEYKRRQAPPGVKITPRAFGRDRRMPITNQCAL